MSGISILANNLGKRFTREWIFRDLNYTFKPGTIYALNGPNGSGKSTLLQVLSGHIPPSSGELTYKSKDDKIIPAEDIYQHVSIAAPYLDLVDEFTLLESLHFHFKLKKSRLQLSVEEMIDRMYLQDSVHKHVHNFSSGMKQRLKLALAFYSECDILLLDEPGTNLDQQAFKWYLSELQAISKDTLTVIASNNPAEYPDSSQIISIADYKR
jgi:ABC-type multidrug transport system ATPase subunit